ncbi:MAG: methionine--tRNA ligase [Bdellovibrionales bacterium RIFOXYD12_FULL_39_22]|nr:MAG: methionine--tRNA ligase [Bdellovibrionales bacterium RIFOXYB1_FULL_39_21]OFZ41201.1 MAG: methionine--tRNA ligase [Bdellovibrionales bacterium RIFOXYC12_FULL_39_17]OFZ44955.1 MAG: methionine--tRNA ligase [Bdellovibrionales bacterium RIFOXYC1_FULL_39_130]OFZ74402.1 MAG: methionine--tRNA ligase [Bdellovibrionales bacterium RIFOXYD1_FULL_39_84]OFZ92404.1 MAG: methionine--tRNA ligase [Bdellovibrionales bacterium RIFOXYD12_FULL_39_22]HLE10732.1 methionine--tRNA ligase [Bacteriovoracaceae bac
MQKFLITAALPYANGPLHFGHLAGAYLPADVVVRHKRLQGQQVMFICGSDEHGVAIMLNAQKEKKNYKEYVDFWHKEHAELFARYDIKFDFFGQTSAKYHQEEVVEWFKLLHAKGYIAPKDTDQLFCSDCKNHLPDRFVEGVCYSCGYSAARGDECPACGLWIEASRLKNPVCKICGSHNIELVSVSQYYLLLSKFHKEFRHWFEPKKESWRKTVYPFVDSLTNENLHDRAITRDLDWGIDVPLAQAAGKKLYVWFDAPIGYVSNTKEYLRSIGSSDHYLNDWWDNANTTIVNFVGKDNIIFHGIIFPVMSLASGRVQAVSDLPANQYVNLEGKQFSKSTGWYIDAKAALDDFEADFLRYYLISIIPESADSSFAWDHFHAKINNELANNVGNLVNRVLKFWQKNWPQGIESRYFSQFASLPINAQLLESIKKINSDLDSYHIRKALEEVMAIGHMSNNFFSDRAPWAQIKSDESAAKETIAQSALLVFVLGVMMRPFLPTLSAKILAYFFEGEDESLIKEIYSGNLSALSKIYSKEEKFVLKKGPDALIPKIDDLLIKKLNDILKQKIS